MWETSALLLPTFECPKFVALVPFILVRILPTWNDAGLNPFYTYSCLDHFLIGSSRVFSCLSCEKGLKWAKQEKKGANFLAIAKSESVNLFSENSDLKGGGVFEAWFRKSQLIFSSGSIVVREFFKTGADAAICRRWDAIFLGSSKKLQ